MSTVGGKCRGAAVPQNHNKPTWSQLKQTVRDVRSHFSSRGLRTPSGITFRKLNDSVTRIYFVSEPHFKRDTSLLYVDLPASHPAPPWNSLLEAGFQCLPCTVRDKVGKKQGPRWCKEEQLMWERKKVSSWGITSYDIHLPTGWIIFPAGGSLYYCLDRGGRHCGGNPTMSPHHNSFLNHQPSAGGCGGGNASSSGAVFPFEVQTKTTGARLNATMCPANPSLIAFVNNGDLWVSNLETRQEERLTYFRGASAAGVADDPLSAGLPSYVMQEEFSRYTGFWWKPETNSSRSEDSYTILYEELDERAVEIVRILGYSNTSNLTTYHPNNSNYQQTNSTPYSGAPGAAGAPNAANSHMSHLHMGQNSSTPNNHHKFHSHQGVPRPEVEEFRYPRTDTANAASNLRLVRFTLGCSNEIIDWEHYDLCPTNLPINAGQNGPTMSEGPDGRCRPPPTPTSRGLSGALAALFPWAEYLVRAGWTPDGDQVWVQLLDRAQLRLELVLIPVSQFVRAKDDVHGSVAIAAASPSNLGRGSRPTTAGSASSSSARSSSRPTQPENGLDLSVGDGEEDLEDEQENAPREAKHRLMSDSDAEIEMNRFSVDGCRSVRCKLDPPPAKARANHHNQDLDIDPIQVITNEQSDSWVGVHDILHFLPSQNPNQIRFIWASEETGFRHLYLVVAAVARGSQDSCLPESVLIPRIISRQQLTHGEWEVLNKPIVYDSKHEFVYFHGLADTVLEPHLYVVSLRQPGEIRRLTTAGYSHSVEISPDCDILATVFSSVNSLPGCQVFSITNQTDNTVSGVNLVSLGWILQPNTPEKEFPPPELFSHTLISGHKLYGMLYKPHNMMPGVKYPVMLNVYGGPELQLVSNSFKGLRELRSHLLASQGYAVVCIDNRGSLHRGCEWEAWLKGRLGQVELADQVEVLHWLASLTGFLDLNRVAVHGWSYGGYLSLMALIQYPQEFKLAVAGAPVTCWELYDTGYTERYLETPCSQPASYKLGSILNLVSQLPEEEGRLLLMHGTMDENVHFMQHTAQLVNMLVKHGKPYQLQIYPSERHSLRHPDSNEHYLTTLLAFLKKNL